MTKKKKKIKFTARGRMKAIAEKYPPAPWAICQFERASGLVEDICEHGQGHPNKVWLTENWRIAARFMLDVHGCDGCCSVQREDKE